MCHKKGHLTIVTVVLRVTTQEGASHSGTWMSRDAMCVGARLLYVDWILTPLCIDVCSRARVNNRTVSL